MNVDCAKNPLITDVADFVPPTHFYASTIPTKEYFANGRHFFVAPDEDLEAAGVSPMILNEEILRENPHAANAVQKIRESYDFEKQERLGDILNEAAFS